jgi:hypothetical protein
VLKRASVAVVGLRAGTESVASLSQSSCEPSPKRLERRTTAGPFKIAAMVAGAVILTEFAFALWFYWM